MGDRGRGQVGSEGQTQSKSFATPEKAAAAAEKKINEKLRKGYAEVSAGSAPAPKPAVDDVHSEMLVRSDELHAAPRGEVAPLVS